MIKNIHVLRVAIVSAIVVLIGFTVVSCDHSSNNQIYCGYTSCPCVNCVGANCDCGTTEPYCDCDCDTACDANCDCDDAACDCATTEPCCDCNCNAACDAACDCDDATCECAATEPCCDCDCNAACDTSCDCDDATCECAGTEPCCDCDCNASCDCTGTICDCDEQPGQTITVNIAEGITMTMNQIEANAFTQGQAGIVTPVRQVTLTRSFFMGIHEVTQEQFYAVMGYNPSYFNADPAEGEAQGRRPVEQVNWYHAIAFANRLSILQGLEPVYTIAGMSNTDADAWLFANVPTTNNAAWNAATANWNASGFRLPTEAEWEFAARAGTTTQWSFGNYATYLGYYAWYGICCCDDGITREVGQKNPNAWGLYDMHGNVREWVWDWSGTFTASAVTDPKGATSGDNRVFRGGSWFETFVSTRSAHRNGNFPINPGNHLGFRVVLP